MLQVKDIGGKGRVGEVFGTRRIESTRLLPQIAESAQYQPIAFTFSEYCPRSTALRLYHQSFTVRQNLSPEKGLQNCYSIVIITIAIAYSPYHAHVRSPSHSCPTAYTVRAQKGPATCDTPRVMMMDPSRKRCLAWESET